MRIIFSIVYAPKIQQIFSIEIGNPGALIRIELGYKEIH